MASHRQREGLLTNVPERSRAPAARPVTVVAAVSRGGGNVIYVGNGGGVAGVRR